MRDRLGLNLSGALPDASRALQLLHPGPHIADWRLVEGVDRSADSEELGLRYLEVGPGAPVERLRELRAAGYGLVLRAGEPGGLCLDEAASALAAAEDLFEAVGWAFSARGVEDPVALKAPANALVEAIQRAMPRGHPPLPTWLSSLEVGEDAEAPARAVKFAGHALFLIPRVFLVPPWGSPALEPTLRAYALLIAQTENATRIAPTAPGQYRIEIPGRSNRYLLWADPAIRRLPSSLQGPLRVLDLDGVTERIESTRLKLTPRPVFAERE